MQKYEQTDLINDLISIFPEFGPIRAEDNDDEFSSSSLHSVYQSFLSFLASFQPTDKQWQLVADHLSEAVAAGGAQENATDTCILEHLHQVRLDKILRPLLSKKAQVYVRA
jgi:hypothetical protein